MLDEERVSPNEILEAAGAQREVKGGTFLQRTGLYLAGSVGLLATIVILALVWKWFLYAPPAPTFSAGADPAVVKATLDNYRAAQQIALEPFTTLFDSIVVKVLLPVFTSILGYIFGSRANSEPS